MFSHTKSVSSASRCHGSRGVRPIKEALLSSEVYDRFEPSYGYLSALSRAIAQQMKAFELPNCWKNMGRATMDVEAILDYGPTCSPP